MAPLMGRTHTMPSYGTPYGQNTYHVRQARPQQVTLGLDLLNEGVDKSGVALGLLLGIGQELDTVLAHVTVLLE